MAVLIDADNTSASQASALLDELARYGVPTVKRAYGDWTRPNLGGWKEELNRHAIQPMQQFAYTTGKNSTDSALIIDAMDLLYSGNVDAFAIVSSDSDFTRLATRLRESGKTVFGLGQQKTPESLVAAVDRFIYLENLGRAEVAESDVPRDDLRRLLTATVEATSQEDGWASLSAVGSNLTTRRASFDPRSYGFPKLSALVRAQAYLEVEEHHGRTRVRLRSAAPAATARRPAAKKAAKAAKATKAPKAPKAQQAPESQKAQKAQKKAPAPQT
jgi:uncharacterized LabA/DUF88 family protein